MKSLEAESGGSKVELDVVMTAKEEFERTNQELCTQLDEKMTINFICGHV